MRGSRRLDAGRSALWLAAGVLGLAGGPGAGAGEPSLPELPDPLPYERSVKDPIFAVLIGLLDADGSGRLSGERLQREMTLRRVTSRLPYRKVAWVSRKPLEPGKRAEVTLQFQGAIDVDIPYSILGYHPGSMRASPRCRLRENYLGELALGRLGKRFEDVRLFSVDEGEMGVDIDGWVDFLAGSALDDTRVTGLAVLRHQGRRFGLAFGYNKDGESRSGVFDFATDRILVPAPPELKGVAADLRQRARATAPGKTAGY